LKRVLTSKSISSLHTTINVSGGVIPRILKITDRKFDLREISRLSDKVFKIHDGKIAAQGTPAEVFGVSEK
jgi:hypothetical protein